VVEHPQHFEFDYASKSLPEEDALVFHLCICMSI
jgi:hypothetical protein